MKVMVDCFSTYRMRYCVEVPEHLTPEQAKEWAMDTVTCEEAEEFSQLWLGEQISSTRIVSDEEYIQLFDEDNDYLKGWDRELKFRNVTKIDSEGNIMKEQENGTEEFVSSHGC